MKLTARLTAATMLLIFAALLSSAPTVSGQDVVQPGKIGLSAAIQSEQLDVLVPVWLSERFALVPAVGITHVSDAATDFGFGLGFRYALQTGKARPYIGARVGMLMLKPDSGDSKTDYIFGPAIGGEYFIDKQFSFGVEAQINMALSDKGSFRFGNPDGTNINTATMAVVTFYFK